MTIGEERTMTMTMEYQEEEEKKEATTSPEVVDRTALESLSLRLGAAEKERDERREALASSESINAQLKSENDQLILAQQAEAKDADATCSGSTGSQQDEVVPQDLSSEVERLKAELERVRNEANEKIQALTIQVEDLQSKEASLLETKQRLVTRINELLAENEKEKQLRMRQNSWGASPRKSSTSLDKKKEGLAPSSFPPPELKELRDKLDTIDLGKEQSDFIAEKVLSAKKSSGFWKNPFADKEEEEYGYRIRMPEELEDGSGHHDNKVLPEEILGEDIFIPSPEPNNDDNDNKNDNTADATEDDNDPSSTATKPNRPWWDQVSLQFDNDPDDIREELEEDEKRSSFFDRIFGGD